MKHKPTIYLDTSVLSSLHYRGGALQGIARRLRTEEWWEQERQFFDLYTSPFALDELSRGIYGAQEAAVREARRMRLLPVVRTVWEAAPLYINEGLIPPSAQVDAFHLAIAVAHRVDYLLTWNQTHLANVVTQTRLESLNRENGWRTPTLVSPDNIPRVLLGQTLRRTDD